MRVAIVGATGLVGSVMVKVLNERRFPVSELIPVASERSAGKSISFGNKKTATVDIEEAIRRNPDIALFSAGSEVSLEWAPVFAGKGTYVIDNSSAWRMHNDKKLIVPEINSHILTAGDRIIANPNCSTIQLVMVLNPLHLRYGMKRVVVSTYQSVTGSGMKAVKQLEDERAGKEQYGMFYPYPIDLNVIPHCDVFLDNGYTKEEMKLVNETKKILNDYNIQITATAVRVPVLGGHSESVNIEFEKDFDINEVRQILQNTPGVEVRDDPAKSIYPLPRDTQGKDEVFAGRIRRDFSQKNSLNLWITADNLRKGAATNAVQIAFYVMEKFLRS